MINRINGFIEEKDGVKFLNIADTDRNSEAFKKYKEVWVELDIILRTLIKMIVSCSLE